MKPETPSPEPEGGPPPPPAAAGEPATSGPRPSGGPAALDQRSLRPVTIPILVSAIANVVAGYLWFLASCFGLFISAPLLVLATFELWTLARASQLDPKDLGRRVTVLGLLELLAGVFNLVSLICGTLALLNLGKVQQRLAQRRPAGP